MLNNNPSKIFVVLMSLTLLCGCWDIKEINQRTLPLAIGISKDNDEDYQVSLAIPITRENSKTRIVTEKGGSVSNVLGRMRTNAEDAVDYSHVSLIVIQTQLATSDEEWNKIMKYFMRSKHMPSSALIAFTDDNIEQMFTHITELGYTGNALFDFFNKGWEWAPELSYSRVWEIYQSLFSYTNDIPIPVVHSAKDTILNFKGSAALKNGKITKISPSENHIVNVFRNRNGLHYTEELGIATILVEQGSLKIKPFMIKNEPRVKSVLSLKIEILEKEHGVTEAQIQKELKNRIEQRFNRIFTQAQKNKTDIFSFGQYFRSRIPYHELKNWREKYYPKLTVDFQVHVMME